MHKLQQYSEAPYIPLSFGVPVGRGDGTGIDALSMCDINAMEVQR